MEHHNKTSPEKKGRATFCVILLLLGAAYLHKLLAGTILPNGELLEDLAQMVQFGQLPVAEAVFNFCQELGEYGAT